MNKNEAIVKAYGKIIEIVSPEIPTKYPALAFPLSLLPYPKEEIQKALNSAMAYSFAIDDKKMLESLESVSYMLTLFVEDEEAEKRNKPLLEHLKNKFK